MNFVIAKPFVIGMLLLILNLYQNKNSLSINKVNENHVVLDLLTFGFQKCLTEVLIFSKMGEIKNIYGYVFSGEEKNNK